MRGRQAAAHPTHDPRCDTRTPKQRRQRRQGSVRSTSEFSEGCASTRASKPSSISRAEELGRVAVLKAETPRETWILRAGADVNTLRRIEAVLVNEHRAESRQRLS